MGGIGWMMEHSSSHLRLSIVDTTGSTIKAEKCLDLNEADILRSGFRYALALANDHHDAEDLVQQGCLRLYRRHGKVDHLPLLFTTIRNLFFDQRQRLAKLRMVPLEGLDEKEIDHNSDSGHTPMLARVEIDRLMANLRAKEREVLFLHYAQGCTAVEISRLTSQPRGSVLSLLQRTRKKLGKMVSTTPFELQER